MSIDEKLNMIYYEIKSKNNSNNYKIENNIQFEYLNNISPNCDSNKNENEKYDIMLNKLNDFILQKDKDKINIIETIDKKIGETIKLYESLMKELILIKNNIINKTPDKGEENDKAKGSQINISINNTPFNDKEKLNNNTPFIDEGNENETPFGDDEKIDNYIIIKYKNEQEKVKIFGKEFVENNKNILKIEYNDKEYDLIEFFHINDMNKSFIDIKLKNINNASDLSYIFRGCNNLVSFSKFNITKALIWIIYFMIVDLCLLFLIFQIGIHLKLLI